MSLLVDPFRKASFLLGGQTASGVLTLGALALSSRALGIVDFGVLMLIHGTTQTIGQIVRFQSWEPILRYGAQAREAGDVPRLHRLLAFSFGLDVLAAVVGLLVVLAAMGPLAALFEISAAHQDAARLYGTGVALMVLGAAHNGTLRLFDRFDLVAVQSTLAPAVRCVGAAVLFAAGGGLTAFLVLWFVALAGARLGLVVLAWRELFRRDLVRDFRAGLDHRTLNPEPGIWRFVAGTNVAGTLNLANTRLPLLIVGAMLSPAAAGLYRIAEQFADLLVKPSHKMLAPAIYPELAHLSAANKPGKRRRMVLRSAALAGGLALVLFFVLAAAGKPLIMMIVGADYAPAHLPMVLLTAGGVLAAWAFPLAPLLSAAGRVRSLVIARIAAMTGYLAAMAVLVDGWGLVGAAAAMVVHGAVTLAGLGLGARNVLGTARPADVQPAEQA
ncbi:lipopolysaccharide biosynthesis protein [Rhodovibrio sodomensis]|uniref:lipopolysaccharide biosynthesis protein n=1 Tax=Rhodovibrio sodomensis TaxID=1088 RepID=UPI0019088A0C|nr:lipopolysaccharide biosynthesis protein [Rhodovibrio sodomensis]